MKTGPCREKSKVLRSRVEHGLSRDVRRHQIGRELDSAELTTKDLPQKSYEQRLSKSWHAFNQHVSTRHKCRQRQPDKIGLSDIDLAHFGQDGVNRLADFPKFCSRFHVRYPMIGH